MDVTILKTFTDGMLQFQIDQELSVPKEVAYRWVADGLARIDTDGQQRSYGNSSSGPLSGANTLSSLQAMSAAEDATARGVLSSREQVATSRAVLATDNGATRELAAGVTLTLNDTVPLTADLVLQGPVSGSATLAVSGAATMNGAATAITIPAGKMAVVSARASSTYAYLVVVQA